MDNVNLYIYSSVKGNARKTGAHIYILEMQTLKGAATLTAGPMVAEDVTGYQSELMAINEGLKRLTRPCNLIVHTSNVLLMAALQNGWYKGWAEKNYKNSKGDEVFCAEEWRSFNELLKGSSITDVVSDKHSYLSWMETECNK